MFGFMGLVIYYYCYFFFFFNDVQMYSYYNIIVTPARNIYLCCVCNRKINACKEI